MGQVLGQDRFGSLQRNSTTQVQLNLSTSSDIRVTVGGQQYFGSSALLLNTSGTGFGGLDTGSIVASQVYFVHLVLNGSTPALIASLSKTAPTGYTSFMWVGVFSTNASSQVDQCGSTTVKILRSLLSGSGTYTTQAVLLKIRMVGGGGGGGNGAGAGGSTTFGTSLFTSGGGAGGSFGGASGGIGGTPTIGSLPSGAYATGFRGGAGLGGAQNATNDLYGLGGLSPFGGNGTGSSAALTNSGSGGGGGGPSGGGGGSGAHIEGAIPNPLASYPYTIGAAGAAGGGYVGASGAIYIEESYV